MMDIGQRLGLLLLYCVMGANAVLMLRIFIQILFRAPIERRRRRQCIRQNGGEGYTPRTFVGKRGWANSWLPSNSEIVQPPQDGNSAGKLAGAAAPIVKEAIALLSIVIAIGLPSTVAAQPRPEREVSASVLKQQLLEIESKETRIRIRLEEIDEQLRPESIERELAGIGSVHPEELREHRRKLLTIERNGLQTQLDLLVEDRTRIEAAITSAEAAAYLKYVQPSPSPVVFSVPAKRMTEMASITNFGVADFPLQTIFVAIAMLVLLGGGFSLLLIMAIQKVERRMVSVQSGSSGFPTSRNCSSDPPLKRAQGVQS